LDNGLSSVGHSIRSGSLNLNLVVIVI
jgi:hypothetical protein